MIPTYLPGFSLWNGLRDLLRWSHTRVERLRIVLVDDGSPLCAFQEAAASFGTVELISLVNPVNHGQSETSFRGFEHCDTDWVIFLEDDLLDWVTVVDAVLEAMTDRYDLVSVARPVRARSGGQIRKAIQPLVRRLVQGNASQRLRDPTSPLKAVRMESFPTQSVDRWRHLLIEGFVFESRAPRELFLEDLRWAVRPSRYSLAKLLATAVRLAWGTTAQRMSHGKDDASI